MIRLKQKYIKKIIPEMKKKFGYKNNLAVPKIEKVVISIGTGQTLKEKGLLDKIQKGLEGITGQHPLKTSARKAISGFGIRKGDIVGMMVTLRGEKMYGFVDKLINAVLPRIRDFRGISPKAFDGRGNLTTGIKEHTVFPEVEAENVEKTFGMEITIVTTAAKDKEGRELLKLIGFPIRTH